MCVPTFILKYGDYVNRTAVAYNFKSKKLFLAKKMKKNIRKCKNTKNVRFIFFTFIIIPSKKAKITHANMVIIDWKKKTVERFEPHGHYNFNPKISCEIDKLFSTKILPKIDLTNFSYLSPTLISPKLGIQSKTDAYNGMCITISMMYLHIRVLNPDIKQIKLVKFLLNRPVSKLKKMILKYARHVENILKKNKNIVLKLFDDVYQQIDEL